MGQCLTQVFVDHDLEWTAGTPRFGLQARSYVVIQGKGGSHIMMLFTEHHDVKLRPFAVHSRARLIPVRN